MAHVLFVSTGRTSLRNRCIELCRRLERAGHRTTFAGPESNRESLARNGVAFESLDTTAPEPQPAPHSRTPGPLGKAGRWSARVRAAKTRRAEAASRLVDPNYATLVAQLQPDLVLVDIELQPYVIASHGLVPRMALLCPFIAPRKVRGVPPLHTAIRPGRRLSGSRLGIEWSWLRYRTWKAWKHVLPKIQAPGSDAIAVLRALADRVGFPHQRELALYDWLLPLSFRTLPTLNLNAVELDFPHHPHPSQRHTGPLIRLDRDDRPPSVSSERLDALGRVLERRAPDRRLIYCAFGTAFAGDDTAFITRLIDAVRRRQDWDVLITLGGRSIGDLPGDLPGHVHIFDWVPQLDVLEQSDCAVLHAGPGSIYECIHFGVPMVLYPFRVNDQLGYAARAAYHRLGLIGDRDADDSARIRMRIEEVLEDDTFRQAVRAMAAALERYDKDDVAVKLVESLLTD